MTAVSSNQMIASHPLNVPTLECLGRYVILPCKPWKARLKDERGFNLRTACICFKDNSMQEVLLITSKKNSSSWKIPGGGVEPDETLHNAACREVKEECGAVCGLLGIHAGVVYSNNNTAKTYVFGATCDKLLVLDDWEEGISNGRKRGFFHYTIARELLSKSYPDQVRCLDAVLQYYNVIQNKISKDY